VTVSAPAEPASTFALPVPGAELHVVLVGPAGAAPLLVLHGGPGEAHDCLRPHLDRLASARRRIVYHDQRGGGRSPLAAGAAPGGWKDHVADVDAVRRHLGADRVDVLGFSWGALLALLYALEHEDRVARLVLVSPPPTGSGHDEAMRNNVRRAEARPEVQAFVARMEAVAGATRDPEAARRARFAQRVAPYFAEPERALSLAPVETREEVAAAVARSLRAFDVGKKLEALRAVPALVIHGAEDPVPAAAHAETAARLGARRLALGGAGHAPFIEAEAAFFEAVAAFLDGAT
jgi:proline iminopeptidase